MTAATITLPESVEVPLMLRSASLTSRRAFGEDVGKPLVLFLATALAFIASWDASLLVHLGR